MHPLAVGNEGFAICGVVADYDIDEHHLVANGEIYEEVCGGPQQVGSRTSDLRGHLS